MRRQGRGYTTQEAAQTPLPKLGFHFINPSALSAASWKRTNEPVSLSHRQATRHCIGRWTRHGCLVRASPMTSPIPQSRRHRAVVLAPAESPFPRHNHHLSRSMRRYNYPYNAQCSTCGQSSSWGQPRRRLGRHVGGPTLSPMTNRDMSALRFCFINLTQARNPVSFGGLGQDLAGAGGFGEVGRQSRRQVAESGSSADGSGS